MMPAAKFTGRMISHRRRLAGFSQGRLARLAGVTTSALVSAEVGQLVLKDGHLAAVAWVLGCEPGDLLPPAVPDGAASRVMQLVPARPVNDPPWPTKRGRCPDCTYLRAARGHRFVCEEEAVA